MGNGWAEQRIAQAYCDLEQIADDMPNGSTEASLLREALRKIELADTYVEKRIKEESQ